MIGCFLAEKLVGIIGVKNNNNHLIIRHISVLEEFQQTGIRTRLINYVIDHFKPNKILAETDKDPLNFYVKLGFNYKAIKNKYNKNRYQCELQLLI